MHFAGKSRRENTSKKNDWPWIHCTLWNKTLPLIFYLPFLVHISQQTLSRSALFFFYDNWRRSSQSLLVVLKGALICIVFSAAICWTLMVLFLLPLRSRSKQRPRSAGEWLLRVSAHQWNTILMFTAANQFVCLVTTNLLWVKMSCHCSATSVFFLECPRLCIYLLKSPVWKILYILMAKKCI